MSWKVHLHPEVSARAADIIPPEAAIEPKAAPVGSTDPTTTELQTFCNIHFDYIVIGGGTAGLTIGSRLAENGKHLVAVIESGVDRANDALVTTPGLFGQSMGNPNYDWSFQSTKQPHLNNREIPLSGGKILGGSSAINFLVQNRASVPEYDAWSKLGNSGWDWGGILPFFKKPSKYTAPRWDSPQIFFGITKEEDDEARKHEPEFEGYQGPISHTYNEIYTDVLEPTILTLNSLGVKTNRAPDHGDNTGIFNISTAVERELGKRSYATNYLKSRAGNLKVLTSAHVTRINFGKPGEDGRRTAISVDFLFESSPYTVKAQREVILSAGAYNSPQVLERSGIGNPSILKPLGIEPIIPNAAVGENLQDHLYVVTDYVVNKEVFTLDKLRIDKKYAEEQAELYKVSGKGAFATTVSAYGFVPLDRVMSKGEATQLKEDLDKELRATANQQTDLQKAQYKIQRSFLELEDVGDVEIIMVPKVFASTPEDDTSYMALLAGLTHPISRGSVHISSRNAFSSPIIDPGYLKSEFDAKCLAKTLMFLRKLTNTEPLKSIISKASTPSADVQTEEQWDWFARNHANSIQHPIGTVAMAPKHLGGVVDSKLLVYGTTNLRVADMSVAPLHIACHTAHTAYAIGEKAYELISRDAVI
ncbi:alcohol oxidase [Pluteus cervinus]|uniref:Alcohol oxidase n=1 Tax=Pluteus cervinus TaxID=181527 RepID=A0ACD3B181_9AGAR|nr:alcohol oxidase [Pluteus cervinus]